MESVGWIAIYGVIFFLIFGAVCGVALALAAKRFAVQVDPKIEAVRGCLPGANCGACGFAGCESYAEAVVKDPAVPPGKCAPGKQEVADKVAAITGKTAGAASSIVSFLRCSRNDGNVKKRHAYVGFDTCQGATIAFGGPYECNFACVGYGDCQAICPFHAIHMVDNQPVIDKEACTGCGLCIKTCPKQVLQLLPKDAPVYVPCSNKDSGKAVSNVCEAGCVHCGACTRKAKDVVNMVNGKIEIEYDKLTPEMPDPCVKACSKQLIFRYTDAAKQANAVEEIKADQAKKKAAAAAKKELEAAGAKQGAEA